MDYFSAFLTNLLNLLLVVGVGYATWKTFNPRNPK